ncbi:hypothetical protein [Sulfurimonas sp.]|jgi:hypothetical protein|uniref:hypothetical protein n=1 Tax=Sulfurimonas sp. TaxID=2022749 RepID=UPI002A363F96|nr:hypothetical protein [Sulfurimonas sp.]MDY0122960.1 hypothetical protein [Sulfurimonas sp.]
MRVKNELQKQQDKELELDWSFAEWLDHFRSEPTTKELDKMEKQSKDKRRFTHPLNNPNYYPLQGA